MLTSRDRGGSSSSDGRAAPVRARLAGAIVARLSGRPVVVGLALVGVAGAALGLHAWRSPDATRSPTYRSEANRQLRPNQSRRRKHRAETDNRQAHATEVRQVHLRQLQPVLRTDAERLSQVARRMRAERACDGLPQGPRQRGRASDALFSPHRVLSADLPNHFEEYSEAKERLRKSVAEQEEEFHQTIALVMTKLSLSPVGESRRVGRSPGPFSRSASTGARA